jgi:hypothetical protein
MLRWTTSTKEDGTAAEEAVAVVTLSCVDGNMAGTEGLGKGDGDPGEAPGDPGQVAGKKRAVSLLNPAHRPLPKEPAKLLRGWKLMTGARNPRMMSQ